MNDLPNLPELAPKGSPTASPRLRPVHGQDGSEHDAGAFMRSAQDSTGGDGGGAEGVAVEGAPLYTFTIQCANGRRVNGVGYTQQSAKDDAWVRYWE